MPLSGKAGAVYRVAGSSVAMTGEATTNAGDNKTYTITNNAHRYIDLGQAYTVKKNGAAQTASLYTIDFGGRIVFNSAIAGGDVVTIDGKYIPLAQCATFFDWKLDLNLETKDVTTFASGGWAEYIALNRKWNGSAEGYWSDGTYSGLIDQNVLMILYIDAAGFKRYEGYLLLSKTGIEAPASDVVKESIDFSGTGILNYREG